MTSGSRLVIIGLPQLVGGFLGVQACFGVFWGLLLSLYLCSPGPP
jgi:hypothetical protein